MAVFNVTIFTNLVDFHRQGTLRWVIYQYISSLHYFTYEDYSEISESVSEMCDRRNYFKQVFHAMKRKQSLQTLETLISYSYEFL